MLGQKNKTHMVVGKDLDLLAEGSTRDSLAVGQIGIFPVGGTSIDGTTDLAEGDKFKVVFKDVDGKILESPVYEYSKIRAKSAANYAASTEQKTFIGFDGTSGAIDVANSDIYHLHIVRKDWSKTWGEHGSFKLLAAYESTASATQTEIAVALVGNATKNLAVEKKKSGVEVTRVGLINSAAVTAANALDNNTTVVKGTKAVVVATALAYNTGAGTLAVGDLLRIGSVGGGTAITSNVYKVVSIDGLTVTLDRPVAEASGTYATATDDVEVIPLGSIADYGISIESLPVKFVPGLFKFQNVTFTVSVSDAFGVTPVTTTVKPYKGVGTYQEVAEYEWELRNNQREAYHVAKYPVSENLNATSGKTYDMIFVDFYNDNARTTNQLELSFFSLIIATEDESGSTVFTSLKDVLNIA